MEHTTSANTSPSGTVVALVGETADTALDILEGIPGVETLSLRDSEPALAARRIAATTAPWVIHDADPLEHVASAWIELYEERVSLGTLEIEVETILAAFRAGVAVMPDYYIVLDPDSAEVTWRHWWCGALGRWAPRRILPAATPNTPADATLRGLLASLPISRPWPDPHSWLPDLPFAIPDRVGLRDAASDDDD